MLIGPCPTLELKQMPTARAPTLWSLQQSRYLGNCLQVSQENNQTCTVVSNVTDTPSSSTLALRVPFNFKEAKTRKSTLP